MERLLSGDGSNERRKSIKTYREIVEEKYVFYLSAVVCLKLWCASLVIGSCAQPGLQD